MPGSLRLVTRKAYLLQESQLSGTKTAEMKVQLFDINRRDTGGVPSKE
jgi:hypothetical protein